jgi:Kef-type K+ transport system membrane component KefB
MRKVAAFSVLLLAGMVGSQVLPDPMGELYTEVRHGIQVLTMVALAFIMIHVGYEFKIDKSKWRQYGWDYIIAMTAAAFPWILVCLYFVGIMLPSAPWSD